MIYRKAKAAWGTTKRHAKTENFNRGQTKHNEKTSLILLTVLFVRSILPFFDGKNNVGGGIR